MASQTEFPTASMVATNGINLEVFEAGKENTGNPIILCHGWPEIAYSWRHQIPALVDAGFHVIAPNQRGYGNSSKPSDRSEYDITNLAGDLIGLLDHYGYEDATFVGHDWGANVVWGLALLHPERVKRLIALSVPYQDRGDRPWVEFIEGLLGPDNYIVHFNRQPGVADAILEKNTEQFLRNMYRKNVPMDAPEPGMMMINLAKADTPKGDAVMNDEDLVVFVGAFKTSGFESSLNWYRNLDRNWHVLGVVDPIVRQPTLMIYGDRDLIPQPDNLADFVPNVTIAHLDCGHWIQQERPEETTRTILEWLTGHHGKS